MDTVAYARWLVIAVFKGVRGPICQLRPPLLVAPFFACLRAASARPAAPPIARTAEGSRRTSFEYCTNWFDNAAPSSSAMPNWYLPVGRRAAALTVRGTGPMSRIALASATPAWPSMPA